MRRLTEFSLSFEERNFIERSNFHRIQTFLRWTRYFIILLYVSGVVFVSIKMHDTMTRIQEINRMSKTTVAFHTPYLQHAHFRREIESEGYHVLNLCLFLIVNTFGVVSVVVESFSLVLVYFVANLSIFALSFTDDNSVPNGLIYKLLVLALVQSTLVFYFLMRRRRVSLWSPFQ